MNPLDLRIEGERVKNDYHCHCSYADFRNLHSHTDRLHKIVNQGTDSHRVRPYFVDPFKTYTRKDPYLF